MFIHIKKRKIKFKLIAYFCLFLGNYESNSKVILSNFILIIVLGLN